MDDSNVINTISNKRLSDSLNIKCLSHLRLGHVGDTRISKLEKDGLIGLLEEESYPSCELYILGKMARSSFDGYVERAAKVLELVHINICGPYNEMARGGFLYFITFIDDYSWYSYVYVMKCKLESLEMFREFRAQVEKQIGKHIKVLRSDHRGKYMGI